MNGAKLSRLVIATLEAEGFYVVNVIASGKSGTSDLLACSTCGRFVSLEIKGDGDTLKPLQSHKIDRVNSNKGVSLVVRCIADLTVMRLHLIEGTSPELSAEIQSVTL